MREIKFRAWDGKQMHHVMSLNDDGTVRVRKSTTTTGLIHIPIVMQFTGLQDRSSKDIYEGDIVKILYTDWPSCSGCHESPQEHMDALALMRVVIWSVQGFYVSHKVDGYAESMEPGTHGFIEVIGNIYENPELLKGKDK